MPKTTTALEAPFKPIIDFKGTGTTQVISMIDGGSIWFDENGDLKKQYNTGSVVEDKKYTVYCLNPDTIKFFELINSGSANSPISFDLQQFADFKPANLAYLDADNKVDVKGSIKDFKDSKKLSSIDIKGSNIDFDYQHLPDLESGFTILISGENQGGDIKDFPDKNGSILDVKNSNTYGNLAEFKGRIFLLINFEGTQVAGKISDIAFKFTRSFYLTSCPNLIPDFEGLEEFTNLETLSLMRNNWTTAEVDSLISQIYNNQSAFTRRSKRLIIFGNDSPSATGMAQIEELRNNGWSISI